LLKDFTKILILRGLNIIILL